MKIKQVKIHSSSASFLFFSFVILAMFWVPLNSIAQILSGTADGVAQTAYTDGSANDDVFIFCGSGNNGALEVGAVAGTGPYSYVWYQYNTTNYSWTLLPSQTSSSIINLANGGYRVEIFDNSGTFLLDDIAWIWNINVNLNAIANASACNDVNLIVTIPNLQFSYHNPPAPAAIINNNTDITVCFSGNHTYVSDLAYYLVGPPSCGSPVVTLATNNNNVCNPGNNLNNLCFTTFPSPNFNVCNQNTPLNGTFDSYSGNPINWNPLNGCNAAEGGWEVMVYDCEFDDIGTLTHASVHFQNLPVVNGSPSDILFDSGTMNSPISDFSCSSGSASHFTVPPPAIYTTPISLNATLTGNWSTSGFATIADPSINVTTADGAMNGDVFTYSLAVNVGTATCNFSDDVTYNNANFVPLSISYSSNLCEGGGVINPIITGGNGGTFSAAPSGLSLSNNGNIQLNTSTPGTYVVTYTKTIGGCVLKAKTGLTVQDVPENLALSPSSICEGATFNGTATLAYQYEYFLNSVSQGVPNSNSATVSPAINLNDDWCVRGYEASSIVIDGQISESYWGQPLSQANSNLTSSFGNNHLDALHVAQYRDTLNIALSGQIEAGTNNRFLLFLDTETGGYNQLSAWTNRSNAPYYSMENLSGNIQFDAGFEPDYVLALNTDAGGISYLDLYHMPSNTNQFIGNSNGSNLLAYQPSGSSINLSLGYEMKVALSNLNNPSGNIQLFGMLVNNPGSAGIATTLSNQFLSPADDGALSYGDDVVIFGAATPDPVHFIVGNTNCYLETCLTVNPNQPVNTPVVPDQCQNTPSPFVLNSTVGGVSGTWSPAVVNFSTLGTSIYTFTPDPMLGCYDQGTAAISVIAPVDPVFAIDNSYCQGETPAILPTSDGTISGVWSPTSISTSASAAGAPVSYTFTPSAGQCANSYSFNVSVNPEEVPVFSLVTSLCQNATAPALPLTDNNGIQGTWNSPITTATLGSQTHTFTPSSTDPAHVCAVPLNVTVNITNGTPATFAAVGPYCQTDSPSLPATSNEGFTGTWTPSTINMSNFSATGQNFTFQVDPNQCASDGSLNVVVLSSVTPTFNAFSSLCLNATPPALPSQSLQNIAGSWTPSIISTSTAGTSSYSFTPASGACATTANVSVTVQTPTAPTFTLPASICKNATAPVLSGNSTNGVTGTWSPAAVNSSVVGNQSFTYTPNASMCATTYTYSLTVNDNQVPSFNSVGPFCINSTPTALPAQSLEPISGTWSPATISTASSGTSIYTFTPAAGLCAVNTTMSVTVASQILPTFAAIPTLCSTDTAPSLANTSNNSITGTWSPSSINMSNIGTNAYVFTPAANQCAANQTVNVTINSPTVPTFNLDLDYCLNETPASLPASSTNMINGSWSPTAISTTSAGSSTYSFTPSVGQCASNSSVTVVVNTPLDAVFAGLDLDYCQSETPAVLVSTDDNGVNGTWSPLAISTATAGTTSYTFNPAVGECANAVSVDVLVNSPLISSFGLIQDQYCLNDVAGALPAQNNDGITGTWNPNTVATSSVGNVNYIFTPAPGNCYTSFTQPIQIITLPTIGFTTDFSSISCAHPDVVVTATGGVNYAWDDGTTGDAITTDINFFNPGITVEDANGCINQANYTVPIDTSTTSQLVYTTDVLNCLTTNIPLQVVGGQTYLWNPGGANFNVLNVNQPGTYVVDIQFANGCSKTMSVDISIDTISPVGNITNFSGFDTLTCTNSSITLQASGGVSYDWYNGGNATLENYLLPGQVFVEVTGANHCLDTAYYTLYQNVVPPVVNVALSEPAFDCFVDSILMTVSGSGVAYQWSNALGTASQVTANSYGDYSVTAIGVNGCTQTESIHLPQYRFSPDSIFTYSPQIIMDDDAVVTLNGPSAPDVVYTWYVNDSMMVHADDVTIQIPPFHTGDFEICLEAVYTELCKSQHCQIITINESLQCYVPNTFTPDQDNLNDGFKPSFSNIELLERYEIVVMNRWGEIIFRSNDPAKSWDGRYLDGEYYVPDGEYIYRVTYKDFSSIPIKEMMGYIRILR